jgi:competence protein ComEC
MHFPFPAFRFAAALLLLCAGPLVGAAHAQEVTVTRNVTIRVQPDRHTIRVAYPAIGSSLVLLDGGARVRGYYHVRLPDGRTGWVYYTFVRRVPGDAALPEKTDDKLLGALLAPAGNEMVAHFIDVDQGMSVLLEFPCGAALIDAGGWGNPTPNQDYDDSGPVGDHLIAYLNAFFARRTDLHRTLDVVFQTHAHIDHNRYMRRVVSQGGFTIGGYVHNGTDAERHSGSANARWILGLPRPARLRNAPVTLPPTPHIPIEPVTEAEIAARGTAGVGGPVIDPIACPGVDPEILVLSGSRSVNPGWSADDFKDDNNHSLVIRVRYDKALFLFSGDMETKAMDALVARYANTPMLDVGVWAAGHHGSENGTTDGMVLAMSPEIAVLSVGPSSLQKPYSAWQYGHPRSGPITILERYIERQRTPRTVQVATGMHVFSPHVMTDAIYATGWDGDVAVTGSADGTYQVKTDR